MSVQQPILQRDRSYRRALWIGFLAGPVIHIVYFLIVYTLGEFGCLAGLGSVTVWGMNLIVLVSVVLGVIAAAATLIIGIRSFGRWRRIRNETGDWSEEPGGFMSFTGAWLNGLYTVIILLTGLQTLFIELCEWV